MIRFINCIKKRSDVSDEDFRRYWQDPYFDTLIVKVVTLIKPERYERNLTLKVQANELIQQERGSREPFDATIEYWWTNAQNLLQVYNSDEAAAVKKEMLTYQQQFVDLAQSCAFFTEAS